MIYVWDTDTFSWWLRGAEPLVHRFAHLPDGDAVFVTAVTAFEVLRGRMVVAARAQGERQHAVALAAFVAALTALGRFRVLPYSIEDAERVAQLRTGRGTKGRCDLRIAAIALGASAVLVTRNVSHFKDLPGLAVENWLG